MTSSSLNSSTHNTRYIEKNPEIAPSIKNDPNEIKFYGTVGSPPTDVYPKRINYISTYPKKDAMCLARMIYLEARGDIFTTQADENNSEMFVVDNYNSFLAHANVVMLRTEHEEFAGGVCSVINERGQFSPKLKDKKIKYNQDMLNSLYSMSVDFLLMGYRMDNTDSALFFQIKSPKTKKRTSYNGVYYKVKTKSISSHDFFKLEPKKD